MKHRDNGARIIMSDVQAKYLSPEPVVGPLPPGIQTCTPLARRTFIRLLQHSQ